MSKPTPRAPAESVALYEALVATQPGVERKGAAMPYTSVNGNMFSLLTPEGTLALRLSEPDRAAFLAKYGARQPVQYGVVMKEYVAVPAALLKNTRELAKHFAASWRYASSLREKPTTKPKSAAGKRGATGKKSAAGKKSVTAKKPAARKPARAR